MVVPERLAAEGHPGGMKSECSPSSTASASSVVELTDSVACSSVQLAGLPRRRACQGDGGPRAQSRHDAGETLARLSRSRRSSITGTSHIDRALGDRAPVRAYRRGAAGQPSRRSAATISRMKTLLMIRCAVRLTYRLRLRHAIQVAGKNPRKIAG
jgi:hypothetical protein